MQSWRGTAKHSRYPAYDYDYSGFLNQVDKFPAVPKAFLNVVGRRNNVALERTLCSRKCENLEAQICLVGGGSEWRLGNYLPTSASKITS